MLPRVNRWTLVRGMALPSVLLALAIVRVDELERVPSLCLFRNLLGVRCPSCGLTRALSCALHGNFGAAFAYNPLFIVVLPLCVMISLYELFMLARQCRFTGLSMRPRIARPPSPPRSQAGHNSAPAR